MQGKNWEKVEVKVLNHMCLCLTACDYSGVCMWGEVRVISVWDFALFGHQGFSMSYAGQFCCSPRKEADSYSSTEVGL